MDKFDRELQRYLLSVCIKTYPRNTSYRDFEPEKIMLNEDKLSANIYYLSQHGLIEIGRDNSDDPIEPIAELQYLKATCKGIDFMLNDGGLTSILHVQTIRLHRDTVVVLEDLIAISDMSDEQKKQAKSTLGELSTETLSTVLQAITTAGLSTLLGQ